LRFISFIKIFLSYFKASPYGNKDVVEFLLSRGAKVNIKDTEGLTALDIDYLKFKF
jgi:ankyrin repeat protein